MVSTNSRGSVVRSIIGVFSLLAILAASVPATTFAATILTENFGTGSTTGTVSGWTEGNDGAELRSASSGNDSASPDGGRFAVIFGTDGYICRTITTTGYTNVQLSYYWRGDNDSNDSSDDGFVEFKAGSGSCSSGTWTQLQNHDLRSDSSWTTQSAFTNSGFNNTTFTLRFRVDTNHSDEHFRVDGISVTGDSVVTDTTAPTVTGLTNDSVAKKTKTWTWSANETSTFRYAIDQSPTWTPSGSYGNTTTATQPNGNGTYYIHVQAKDTAGNESAVVTVSAVLDNTAPTLATVTAIPTPDNDSTPSYTFSSTEAGAITYGGGCTSGTSAALSGNNTITYSSLAQGTYASCTIVVTDAAGNASTAHTVPSFTIDLTAPVITLNRAATVNLGTGDTYTEEGASATDNVDASVSVSVSGSVNTAAPGTYTITYAATDVAGNSASVQRAVNVSDDDAPVISGIPADIIDEAVDALGKIVSYVLPTANDNVDGSVAVTCTPSSGSAFAITTTTVGCAAQDANGNIANASFFVTIQDTTDPVVTLTPATQDVEATSALGAIASYTVSATDSVDGDISGSVVCNFNSGEMFPLGLTTVLCSVTDALGNEGTAQASITVADTEAPVITLNGPEAMTADQNGSFTDPGATAIDAVEGEVAVVATASGSVGTAGEFTITYTAQDSEGNVATPVVRTITVRPQKGGSISPFPSGEVLGTSTSTVETTATSTATTTPAVDSGEVLGASCEALTSYINHRSVVNNVESVIFLQNFLNKEMGLTLEVNGTFDAATKEAVKSFQLKYWEDILLPWKKFGLSEKDATGVVYKTTQRKINMIMCPGRDIPMPTLP